MSEMELSARRQHSLEALKQKARRGEPFMTVFCEFRVRSQEGGELRRYRRLHQPLRATAQDIGERIVDFVLLTKRNNLTLVHGETLVREIRVDSTPTPLRRLLHTVIT